MAVQDTTVLESTTLTPPLATMTTPIPQGRTAFFLGAAVPVLTIIAVVIVGIWRFGG